MAASREQIAELYVAFFERAPDADGLDYWENSGMPIEDISQSFFDQEETQLKYPDTMTDAEFIQEIYNNLFDHPVDDDGLVYWGNELASGSISRSDMIMAIVNGALGTDDTILANKTEVGLYFADSGLSNQANAIDIVTGVDVTQESVTDAKAQIDIWAGEADTLEYTLEEDHLQGTTGDDNFSGIIDTSLEELSTIQSMDTADGRDGVDTLVIDNVSIDNSNTLLVTENIEVINYQQSTAATAGILKTAQLHMQNVVGLETIEYTNNYATTDLFTDLQNVIDLKYCSNEANDTTLILNYADGVTDADDDEMNVLANTSFNDTLSLNGIETINLSSTAISTLSIGDDALRTLNISSDYWMKVSDADGSVDVTVMDASGSTHGVNIDGTIISAGGAELTGSSGRDILNGNDGDDTISGGEGHDDLRGHLGDDTLIGGYSGDDIYGGQGEDLLIYNLQTDSNMSLGLDSMDTVHRFRSGEDHIIITNAIDEAGGLSTGDSAVIKFVKDDDSTGAMAEGDAFKANQNPDNGVAVYYDTAAQIVYVDLDGDNIYNVVSDSTIQFEDVGSFTQGVDDIIV